MYLFYSFLIRQKKQLQEGKSKSISLRIPIKKGYSVCKANKYRIKRLSSVEQQQQEAAK